MVETASRNAFAPLPVWKTIDSAPKDGQWIILGGGIYEDEEKSVPIAVARWEDAAGRHDEGWVVCCAEAGYSVFYYENPTHWCPLLSGP
ncbi:MULTISPECIES: hypothetical protein [Agrobacterium]|uniref:hypothetical protein n=1 Tax=Agrobacterium TaxID=357 RepID=UPI00104A5717|nr:MULTISPECIES: hypothetical protein [Agrobacterium]MBW9072243.1 hypothetical protein [Agrobacterium deltaense]TCV53950.1 hypothetical protein EDB97_102253 [Agrobacterium tumefaciens]